MAPSAVPAKHPLDYQGIAARLYIYIVCPRRPHRDLELKFLGSSIGQSSSLNSKFIGQPQVASGVEGLRPFGQILFRQNI